PGVPVATVAVDGAVNAGLLAVQILAVRNKSLSGKLAAYKEKMKDGVARKNTGLQDMIKKETQV
ncbi:MAG: AIR carboxylase family protein, partial [Clostridia bacterium]|nr:AIR carboxylase family protein [Clostridia bacterium]